MTREPSEMHLVAGKPWYQSKTIWLNLSAVVAGAATYFTSGDTSALVVAGMGLMNMFLRMISGQPIE